MDSNANAIRFTVPLCIETTSQVNLCREGPVKPVFDYLIAIDFGNGCRNAQLVGEVMLIRDVWYISYVLHSA